MIFNIKGLHGGFGFGSGCGFGFGFGDGSGDGFGDGKSNAYVGSIEDCEELISAILLAQHRATSEALLRP